ncbi:MAG: tetratricopeptide repeat protein [bacterium]
MALLQNRQKLAAIAMVIVMAALVGGAWVLMKGYAERAVGRAEAPSISESTGPPLPEAPSLAVLPFENINRDPHELFLPNGIAETLSVRLGNKPGLFVIAHRSAMAYRGKQPEGKRPERSQIGRALGVSHLLEGGVQKLAGFLLVRARLSEAATGKVVWEREYNGIVGQIFAYQDDIVARVHAQLAGQTGAATPTAATPSPAPPFTSNTKAYNLFLRAKELGRRFQPGTNTLAIQQLGQAIRLDPKYARAMTELGWRYLTAAERGWVKDREDALRQAESWGRRAIKVVPWPDALTLLSRLAQRRRNHAEAVALAERAVALAPNHAAAHSRLAWSLALNGEAGRAMPVMQRAMRLSPRAEEGDSAREAWIYLMAGRWEDALVRFSVLRAWAVTPRIQRDARLGQVVSSLKLGRESEAKTLAETLPKTMPDSGEYRLAAINEDWGEMGLRDSAAVGQWIALLRRAGLKE